MARECHLPGRGRQLTFRYPRTDPGVLLPGILHRTPRKREDGWRSVKKKMKSHEKQGMTTTPLRVHEGREEIENFLRACRTYPVRFASNPRISFEQHLFNISTGKDAPSGERRAARN